jgi:hypothetical protein
VFFGTLVTARHDVFSAAIPVIKHGIAHDTFTMEPARVHGT